jgi:hypothetical protein
MELTANEQRSLQRLVKSQRQWRWFRYVSLLLSVAVVIGGIWLEWSLLRQLIAITRNMSFTEAPTGAEVFFSSMYGGLLAVSSLLPGFGGLLVGLVLARWRGSPVHELLIRMVQDVADPQRIQGGDQS